MAGTVLHYVNKQDWEPRWLRILSRVAVGSGLAAVLAPLFYRIALMIVGLRLTDLWKAKGGQPMPTSVGGAVEFGWFISYAGTLFATAVGLLGLALLFVGIVVHRNRRPILYGCTAIFAAATAFYLSMEIGFVLAGL